MVVKKKKKGLKKKLGASGSNPATLDANIDGIADSYYYKYSIEVIEDRAIFAAVDGLKPVTRRFLWAAYQLNLNHKAKYMKSARISGETMGKYHPHGDSSIYTSMVTAANTPLPMLDGAGNWGTMTDPAAAARYTNARLSLYSDLVFLDKFYLPVTDMVSNYDETMKEPLLLPALLPNALVNGNFGIAPGVRASSPIVRFDTLAKALERSIMEGATPLTCKGIELVTEYGGVMHKPETYKDDMRQFLKTGRGRFQFDCDYKEISSHEIRVHGFPFSNLSQKLLLNIETCKGVTSIRDDSSKTERNVAYVVTFQKSLSGSDLSSARNRVLTLFRSANTFNMQAVERKLLENGDAEKKLLSTSIPDLINIWLDYRIGLEKRACSYWIDKNEREIARLELMLLAVKFRDVIIKLLSNKALDDEQLAAKIAKALKITVEQANFILDLKIRQLKALEESRLKAKVKELREEIAGYKLRIKKPRDYILKHVMSITKKIGAAHA